MGLVGTVVAWGLAAYNAQAGGVSPLVTIAIFFAALVAAVAVLYVVDRSVERQVHHLLGSLEEAMAGDAVLILSREMQGLARKAAVVNGILFYCAAMVAEFIIFTVLLSDGVRQGIDEAVTLEVMRRGFLLPIVPAIVFAAAYHWFLRRAHQARIGLVAARFPKGRPHPRRR